MFNKKEFEERIQLQEEKVKVCEGNCQEVFALLGRQFYELQERPEIAELEEVLEAAKQTADTLESEAVILNELKATYIDEKENSCANCGARIVIEGAKFCYNCGSMIEPENDEPIAAAPVEEKKVEQAFCAGCFSELKPGARFCGKCGKPVE